MDDLVGRTIMVGIRGSRPGDGALEADLESCRAAHVRAVVLFDRDLSTGGPRNIESPAQLRELTAYIREVLGEGCIIAVDQEGGRVARLRPALGFIESPSAAEFAGLDRDARQEVAEAQAQQLAAAGIDLDFAPCVDLALDASSTVIAGAGRSFGRDGRDVSRCARAFVKALDAHGVGWCLKHFPGHGSVRADSHDELPDATATHDPDELTPYQRVLARVDHGTGAVMTAHIMDRTIDPDRPASLSHAHTTRRLRRGLSFDGVIVTDSLDMGAIRSRWPIGEAVVAALSAGADLVLDAANRPGAGSDHVCPAGAMSGAIRGAVASGQIPESALAAAAGRVARFAGRPGAVR